MRILQDLGISPQLALTHSYPSRFPVSRRPVRVLLPFPEIRVDHRMSADDEDLWLRRNDNLIGDRLELGRKGIIHCVSYQRSRRILEASKWSSSIIWHRNSADKQDAIQRYREAEEPCVLLSPGITTGEDFPDDECRWILVPKLSWPDTRSAVMQRRVADDKQYRMRVMLQTLVQACGRGVRHELDWCEMLVNDAHAKYALGYKNRWMMAPWFAESIQFENVARPRPLELEEAA